MNIADAAELARFLEAHPDIRAVQIMITDPSGVLRTASGSSAETGRRIADEVLNALERILRLELPGIDR